MPYALEFYLLLFVAEVAVFLVARSLAPLGLGVNSVFAFAAAYAIVIGRWVLDAKIWMPVPLLLCSPML
jgi:hypothetical protein